MKISKLCLGTAQLGMDYGINNPDGKPSLNDAAKILKIAFLAGINVLDTAPEYGQSEKIIGEYVKNKQSTLFISKVPPTNWEKDDKQIIENLNNSLRQTLTNLNIESLPIYLFHRFGDIDKHNQLLLTELKQLKAKGLIGEIGVSTYTTQEAQAALSIEGITVIQVPFNLIDKRLLENGFLARAKAQNITIFARSVFLQGLFFMDQVPESLTGFIQFKQQINELCKAHKLGIAELALRYVMSIPEINSILIGVEKPEQLIHNIEISKKGPLELELMEKLTKLGSAPEEVINPSLWKR